MLPRFGSSVVQIGKSSAFSVHTSVRDELALLGFLIEMATIARVSEFSHAVSIHDYSTYTAS